MLLSKDSSFAAAGANWSGACFSTKSTERMDKQAERFGQMQQLS